MQKKHGTPGHSPAVHIATCGPVGNIPVAPGTFGSLAGLLLYFPLSLLPPGVALGALAALTLLAIWAAGRAAQVIGAKDPGCIVIDEVAGMAVTLFALPFSPWLAVAGFALFRLLDILKPFPVGYLDKNLKGGPGIVLDDVAAGIICNLVLHLLRMAWKWLT